METTTKKSTQRVLIAQSDPDLADLMREVIEAMGYGVDVAEGGFGVLAVLRGHEYFLLLTETLPLRTDRVRDQREQTIGVADRKPHLPMAAGHLPIMDGPELAEAIRDREGPGQHLPIVAMTSQSESAARVEFIAAGIDDFLKLPLDIDELEETVRTWAD